MGQTTDPQWAPPPQQPSGWGAGGPAPVERPMGVTLGAIYLIVMGVLLALAGAACGIFGMGASGLDNEMPGIGMFGGAIAVVGLILLVLGILQIVAGVGALSGKAWARWTGIILAVIFAVLTLLSGIGTLGRDASSAAISIVMGVLYALTAWAFIKATAYFAYRR